jgi:hypothetical protein
MNIIITDGLPKLEGRMISYKDKFLEVTKVHGYALVDSRYELVLDVKVTGDGEVKKKAYNIDHIRFVADQKADKGEGFKNEGFTEKAYALPDKQEQVEEEATIKKPKQTKQTKQTKQVRRKK